MRDLVAINDKRKSAESGLVEFEVVWTEGGVETSEWVLRKELITMGHRNKINEYQRTSRGRQSSRRSLSSKPRKGHSISPSLSEPEHDGAGQGQEEESEEAERDGEGSADADGSPEDKEEAEEEEEEEAEASSSDKGNGDTQGGDDGMPPDFGTVSRSLGASFTVLGVSGAVAVTAMLQLVLQAILANGEVHHEQAKLAVEWAVPITAVAPAAFSLYGLLATRGHDEPYAKWIAVTLVWITGASLLREMEGASLDGASAADVALGCVGVAATALTFAFAASDGKELPGVGLVPLLLVGGGLIGPLGYALYARKLAIDVEEADFEKANLILVLFTTLFAGMLVQALSRLGLGARSAFSRLSVPHWLGLAGAVFFTVAEVVDVCPVIGIKLADGDIVEKDAAETNAPDAHSEFHYTTKMTLFALRVLASVFLAASAATARYRSA